MDSDKIPARKIKRIHELPMEQLKIDKRSVRFLVDSFFEGITSDQWELIKNGTADSTTYVQIAQFILEVIKLLTNHFLQAMKGNNLVVPEERVLAALGDAIPQCLAKALKIETEVECDVTKNLTNLIAKQVSQSVMLTMSEDTSSEDSSFKVRVIPPKRLNKMVVHASSMLKTFFRKGKKLPKHLQSSRRSSTVGPRDPDSDGSDALPQQRRLSAKAEAVHKIVSKEFQKMAGPLLVKPMDSQFIPAEEMKVMAEAIAQSTDKQIQDPGINLDNEGLKERISTVFAKGFSKLFLKRIGVMLKSMFCCDLNKDSRQSLQSLANRIDSLLFEPEPENLQGEGKVCMFSRLLNLTRANLVVLSEELCDILYFYTVEGEPELEKPQYKSSAIYLEIQVSIWCFLGLMKWWLTFHADTHSDSLMMSAIRELTVVEKQQTPEVPFEVPEGSPEEVLNVQNETEEEIFFQRTLVRILVGLLVTWMFEQGAERFTNVNPELLTERLFEKIWAEVKGSGFEITLKSFDKINKAIFKDLKKKCTLKKMRTVLLDLESPQLDSFIVSLFKVHMTPKKPKRPNAFIRFFQNIGEAIATLFRETKMDNDELVLKGW